jgi:hypothetical protein
MEHPGKDGAVARTLRLEQQELGVKAMSGHGYRMDMTSERIVERVWRLTIERSGLGFL